MFVQTMVCFANSRKDGRRCVAGKTWSRTDGGTWVRPVSRDPSRALPPGLLAYQDGAQPRLLDIMQVPLDSALPEGHQQENALTNPDYFWTKSGQLRLADLGQWLDAPQRLAAREVESNTPRALLDGGCLLCSEASPAQCHRRLVAEYLQAKWGDLEIQHLE